MKLSRGNIMTHYENKMFDVGTLNLTIYERKKIILKYVLIFCERN